MRFTWYGKENAIIESMTPSTGTLRPDKESSKNWDNTENLYIEGDNLEVLKLLQKSYFGKVKMIYIDPPYNTGKDFVYKDNFRDNIANYKEITNQSTKANPETNGRYHTDWLNMMYPRLKLARNLLREDGVIFISIDDNEVDNLRKICDEVFGEENFAAQIIWQKVYSPRMDVVGFSTSHDYILCYVKENIESINREKFEQNDKQFNYFDKKKGLKYRRRSIRKEGSNSLRSDAPNSFFALIAPDGQSVYPIKPDGTESCWRWSIDTYNENVKNDMVEWVKTSDGWQVYAKQYYNNDSKKPPETIWFNNEVNHNHGGAEELKKIMSGKIFDSPKPKELIMKAIKIGANNNDIILDFFSGSSTTAHAVIQMNVSEQFNNKFIMVQIPELSEEKSEAYKAGYKNICEIGKERIRRAGDKIISENKDKEGIEKLDIGFKVFKLEYNCGGENYSTMKEGIKVDIIKRPKDKPICKFKVYGELYYLVKTSKDIIVFPYKSSIKGKVIASMFNIESCKNKDYMQLEYLYNMKLNEFNGEDFIHSQYVTSVILDNVYKNLND